MKGLKELEEESCLMGLQFLACFTFLFFHLDFGSSGVTVGTGWVGLCPNLSKQKKTKKMKIRV
jgi:hypothetical protein